MLAPLLLVAALAAPAPGSRVLDRVAAVVNGEVVTLLEIEERAGPELRRAEALPPGPSRDRERARVLKEAFDGAVSERLFLAQVAALGVEISEAEIDSVIQDVKRRNGLDDDRLDEALRAQGMVRAAYR
jgi:peptidyl-prolyl cis-trans isomerase SurA